MKNLMWLLQLALKAAIFFTLFAFALNNQHDAVVHFFFGTTWSAPLVLVLLTVFVMGVAILSTLGAMRVTLARRTQPFRR